MEPSKDAIALVKASEGLRLESGLALRLWRRVDKSAGDSGCWEWLGCKNYFGYGKIGAGGRSKGWVFTHRVAWEMSFGPIPAGCVICHRCDNPGCCNPAHMFLGTQAENLADMRAKGRHCQGDDMRAAMKNGKVRRQRPAQARDTTTGRFRHAA